MQPLTWNSLIQHLTVSIIQLKLLWWPQKAAVEPAVNSLQSAEHGAAGYPPVILQKKPSHILASALFFLVFLGGGRKQIGGSGLRRIHKIYNKHKEEGKRGRIKRKKRRGVEEGCCNQGRALLEVQTDAGCAGGPWWSAAPLLSHQTIYSFKTRAADGKEEETALLAAPRRSMPYRNLEDFIKR